MKTSKYCPHCEKNRLLKFFGQAPARYDELSSWCKSCNWNYIKEKRQSDPEYNRKLLDKQNE